MTTGTSEQTLREDHPFFVACESCDLPALRKFFESGISVYATSEFRPEPSAYARSCKSIEFLNLLLEFGFDVNHVAGAHGQTELFDAVGNPDPAWIALLLDDGANVNHVDRHGWTPYLQAIAAGNSDYIALVVSRGANTEQISDQGVNDFLTAAKAGHFEIMQYLLDQGRDINFTDCAGSTALVRASKSGSLEVVLWLLDHGADIDAKDVQGKTALQWAETNRHEAVAELLRQRGAK